jgi:hypothetical protein
MWLRPEDRTREEARINPSKVMEALGIDTYTIDWDNRTVYTTELHKVGRYFGKHLHDDAVLFRAHGWEWKRSG